MGSMEGEKLLAARVIVNGNELDFYEMLTLDEYRYCEFTDSWLAELARGFRKASRRYHPDMVAQFNNAELNTMYAEVQQVLRKAKETLGNAAEKSKYDSILRR